MAYSPLKQFSASIQFLGSSQPKFNRIQQKLADLNATHRPLGQFTLKKRDSLKGISR